MQTETSIARSEKSPQLTQKFNARFLGVENALADAVEIQEQVYSRRTLAASSDLVLNYRDRSNSRAFPRNPDRSGKIAEFDGYITELDSETFFVRAFSDATGPSGIEVEFGLDQLLPQDRKIAKVGSPITWTLTSATFGGTNKRSSTIFVRRLVVDEAALERAIDVASNEYAKIEWD